MTVMKIKKGLHNNSNKRAKDTLRNVNYIFSNIFSIIMTKQFFVNTCFFSFLIVEVCFCSAFIKRFTRSFCRSLQRGTQRGAGC